MLFLLAIENHVQRSKLEEIYLLYKKDMYITAYDMVRNQQIAEDIVHNAILRVSKHLGQIEEVESKRTRAYMIVIVKNLCRDHFNKDKIKGINIKDFKPIEEFDHIADSSQMIESGVIRREESTEILSIIKKLKPSYSEVISLRYYDELSVTQIANVLDTSPNNVSVRLNRAIKALHKKISERSAVDEKVV